MKIPVGMLALLSKPKEPVNDTVAAKPPSDSKAVDKPTQASASRNENVVTTDAPRPAMVEQPRLLDSKPTGPAASASDANAEEKSPVDKFRESLDQLDSLLTKDFDAISLALSRDIVKRVMIELRTNPEFNGIVQDGDVRNIFIFLRRAVDRAKDSGTEKVEKKVKRAKKAGAVVINMPDSLDALSGFDTGGIDALLGLGKPKK